MERHGGDRRTDHSAAAPPFPADGGPYHNGDRKEHCNDGNLQHQQQDHRHHHNFNGQQNESTGYHLNGDSNSSLPLSGQKRPFPHSNNADYGGFVKLYVVGIPRTASEMDFRTGFIAPYSRVFGRGVLVENSWEIAKRYLSSYFVIDILAVLPLPQIVIVIIVPKLKSARSLNTKNLLKIVVILQYIPRVLRIYPLYKEVTRSSGILTETAWAGAAFNLFLYMLASHVIGASWYLLSIERETTCWLRACGDNSNCRHASFSCPSNPTDFSQILNQSCPVQKPNSTIFDFGIFLDALQCGVVESNDFPQKFFYCFWWGLQNLSSLGQNLKTSTYVWEICFVVFISISGLVLFSLLIGNMQTYLQSTTLRLEEMRVKRRDPKI